MRRIIYEEEVLYSIVQRIVMNDENVIRWVHISDIHIGHNNYVENAMRNQLPAFLKALADDCRFDFLFITGDLIFSPSYGVQKDNIKDIGPIHGLIKEIQSAIGVDNKRTCMSIGNHDVVRCRDKNAAVCELVKTYRSSSGEIPRADEIFMAESRFSKLYCSILDRVYTPGHFIEKIEFSHGNKTRAIEVLNLDTAITAEATQDDMETRILQDGNLIIGTQLLRNAFAAHRPDTPIIAIEHHPLGALMEDERNAVVREMQAAGINIYLCGHTHRSNIDTFGDRKFPLIQMCCGTNMERRKDQDPTDMMFYVGTYDLDKKRGSVDSYQYVHINNQQWGWRAAMIAPFEQTRFERETGITSYYFPKDSAPYYSLVEKYSNQLSKVVGDRGFYIEPNCTINPKRPTILNPLPVRREIYEADTGYGKTMRLLKIASESLQVCGNRDIREKILNESVICPFFIDFESMSSYRDDSLLLLLAQSIHWSVKLSTRKSKLFDEWIIHLADTGALLLLIDGLDKLEEKDRKSFSEGLQQFLSEHPRVGVCITTKYFVFDGPDMQNEFKDYVFYQINAFDEVKIREYCVEWYSSRCSSVTEDSSAQKKALDIAKQIIGDPALRELACVPLLLNTILQVNKATDALPNNRIRLYDSFVYALLKNEPYPESTIQLLSAIAYEMHKAHTYSLPVSQMKRTIRQISSTCNWLQLNTPNRTKVNPCKFLSEMDNNSRLLRKQKDCDNYSFYNNEIQDYFAALALAKGFYIDMLPALKKRATDSTWAEFPLGREIKKYLTNVENSNMLVLTILQLNAFETSIIIDELIEFIDDTEENQETTIVTSSHLRNLLLRVILDGAYITEEQRHRSFIAVQGKNIFNLQADLLEEVWNSHYCGEFEKTCTHYISTLFKLLKDESNPIQYLYDTIYSGVDTLVNNCELEEKLYVLDGVIWSKGREYLNVYKSASSIEDLVHLLENILKSSSVDMLCKRRACGVLQRLLDNDVIVFFSRELVNIIFHIFETDPRVEYREPPLQDDRYAGIRIFHAFPLDNENILIIKSLTPGPVRQEHYLQLYEDACNPQDKLSAFEASIFCQCWSLEQIENMKREKELFKNKAIDMIGFNLRLQKLIDAHFFD